MKRVLSRILVTSGLVLGASMVFTNAVAQEAAKPDATKGAQLYDQGDAARGIVACASCHGAAGNSTLPVNPNLAGQPHEYLYKQLSNFKTKDGDELPLRRGPEGAPTAMTPMATPLSDDDMRNVALYLSQQALTEPATASNEATAERGQKIWRGGLPERNVPACASCHGATGAGMAAQYPRLSGQFPAYIEAQLRLFRSGDRANDPTMHQIADRMSDADIAAVADYAAGLR